MSDTDDIWGDDLLGFKSRGDAFTNLVTSITDHRTISIEAGYGQGKTFFRERWAKQLRAEGECVVEIDARLSDHSGDPVVTFLGALLGLVPEKNTKKREAAFKIGKHVAVAAAKAVVREGYKDLADAFDPKEGEVGSLHDIAKSVGQDLSKAAGELIATQLSAEKARKELGEQLKALHAEITKDSGTDRIVILIDELDRCHPDYAIALLEAMKLVFDQDGFVFVLMVNREYLEKVAAHRFGQLEDGEFYLDKFVDLRLKLEAEDESLPRAVETLALEFPLAIPFGDHEEFNVERAAKLAGEMAIKSGLSMRQIKRTLDRVELALRIYRDRPIDLALLVWLAVQGASTHLNISNRFQLQRLDLQPDSFLARLSKKENRMKSFNVLFTFFSGTKEFLAAYPEFLTIFDRNVARVLVVNVEDYKEATEKLMALAPHYIPDHQAMLDAVLKLQVDP